MSWKKHWIGLARNHTELGDRAVKPLKPRSGGKPIPLDVVANIKRDVETMPFRAIADLYGVNVWSVRNIASGLTRANVKAAPAVPKTDQGEA